MRGPRGAQFKFTLAVIGGTGPGSLLLRHAGALDHLRPFVDVAAQPRTKLLRCAAFGFNAKLQRAPLSLLARADEVIE